MKDLFEGQPTTMKYIVLIPDGASDQAYEELQGKTPLEASRLPHLDALAQGGSVGLVKTIPDQFKPGSDIGKLSILGYDPKKYYTGRAPLEAVSMGIRLEQDEVAFRMNLITEAEGKFVDPSAGSISDAEAVVLVDYLNQKIGNDSLKFFHGSGYRNIVVLKDRLGLRGLSASCYAPNEITGEKIDSCWPKGPGDELLRKIMLDTKKLLGAHEINHVRIDLGENPANMIWLWGQGVSPELSDFRERTGLRGGVVSAVDILRGIAKFTGLEIIEVPGITGYVDTNYEGKAQYGLDFLAKNDFVMIHAEGIDEASHEGNLKAKIQALEDFDRFIVAAVKKYCDQNQNTRVLVVPDHSSSCKTKAHMKGMVPFVLYGKGVAAGGIEHYNEVQAQASDLRVEEGHKILDCLIKRN